MIVSFYLITRIYNNFDEMMDAYQFADIESDAATSFQAASDYLTNQARLFAVNGNIENANNYFEEKDVIKNREKALSTVENSHRLAIESNLLENAMNLSEALVDLEIHAMKLTAYAYKIDDSLLPSLNESELQRKAILLLYSNEYEEYKTQIDWNVKNAVKLIKDESETRYREDESDLIMSLNFTTLQIFFMFALLMLIFIFTTLLVVKPARKFVALLDNNEKLPVIGGSELRDFARKYNDVYRSDKKNRALLKEHGEVDELTGTLKVDALDFVRHNLTETNEPLGIMYVDIDNFRSIREANGYDMADKLVAKVAKLLVSSFKRSDYVVRISKDEFEVFLLRMQLSDSDMLLEKVAEINQSLKDDSDGVAAASISAGISFSENGYTLEAEQKADMALNYVKENGKGSCKIQ